MSFEQGAILTVLLVMLIAYASERFRIEVVALCGLAAAFALGVVPVESVFSGLASPAVVTVVEILLVVAALSRTRIIDDFARRIASKWHGETGIILFLCTTGAAVSVFMNNIGALALLFPVAISVCARLRMAPARVLMPLSFATLLGGMCSLTGTPANLVVNEWVANETGRNLGYFELGVIGGPLAVIGILWVALAGPRIFERRADGAAQALDAGPTDFLAERIIGPNSDFAGARVPDLEAKLGIRIHGVSRHGVHVFARRADIVLARGDTILFEANIARIEEFEEAGAFESARDASADAFTEVVVMPESLLLGSRIEDAESHGMGDVRVKAMASRRGRIEGRFADLPVSMGDVLLFAGDRDAVRRLASECGLLVLSPRRPARQIRGAVLPVSIFAAGVLATAFDLVPTQIAFGAVVLGLIVTGSLNLRTALQDLNWGIVLLLAAMIPLGLAVEETGAARLIADAIASCLPAGEPLVVVLAILALAVAITPFIDNVSTAVVLSPIAAGLATRTATPVEPLLIAVAIGASLDFLTPFGHHNNAVVMGAGGYRFLDFARLGAPLTVLCLVTAALAFALLLAN
ncbi:MAG: SLC13 family permease [Erythrobacter sp.]|jgi:di/tricarboxylate transporter